MKQLDEKLTPNIMSVRGDSGTHTVTFPPARPIALGERIPNFKSHRNVYSQTSTIKEKKHRSAVDELIHRPKNRLNFIIYCFRKARVQSITKFSETLPE